MTKSLVTAPTNNPALILGIETSCDETAAAVVSVDGNGRGVILSNIVRSQVEDHAPFGGVVPELAARAHVAVLDGIIAKALDTASVSFEDLSAVAATAGPGLIGGLLAGLVTAKALALVHGLPLFAINHLEGHALTVGLTDGIDPPYLLLLVSGGHTEFIEVRARFQYAKLGGTIDDALGEAFDKVAKMLGLGFPGGPAVESHAAAGDPTRFKFPCPLAGRAEPDFSFSGLKTAVHRAATGLAPLTGQDITDLCASFQATVNKVLRDRVRAAFTRYAPALSKQFVVAGGVAANTLLRETLLAECAGAGFAFHAPPPRYCTDNAAMIAWAGACRFRAGLPSPLTCPARARWPLAELTSSAPVQGRESSPALVTREYQGA